MSRMFFIRVHPCHPWLPSLCRGRAGRHGGVVGGWPEILEICGHFFEPVGGVNAGKRLGFSGKSRVILRRRTGVAQFFRSMWPC